LFTILHCRKNTGNGDFSLGKGSNPGKNPHWMRKNVKKTIKIVKNAVPKVPDTKWCRERIIDKSLMFQKCTNDLLGWVAYVCGAIPGMIGALLWVI
jgi:hypothetical protein